MHTLTSQQRDILLFVYQRNGRATNGAEVARELRIAPSSAYYGLNRLVERGFVQHGYCRRCKLIWIPAPFAALTAEGVGL